MITLEIAEPYRSMVDAPSLQRTAQAVLEQQLAEPPIPHPEVTLVIGDDSQLEQLNRQFLGVDAPTDVLAFPAGHTDPDTGAPYLGDVLVSFPRAEAQAAEAGHPVENELQLLVVHGLLHLLGHDHLEAGDKARMWAAQADILDRLGVTINGVPG
jgi:probable rRNA maturation factor